jgi:ATP-dependent DNA ligase
MLARPVTALPSSGATPALFEQKADGFRVLVFAAQKLFLQSRRGADLGPAFPEVVSAAAALGVEAVLDAELVVWGANGLDFTALQERARRRGATARRAALERPAHLIVFDVLEVSGVVLLDEPLRRRRAALEELFAGCQLTAP